MAKEAYYFAHDYEPISDPKIAALIGEFGGIGYGIFWRVTEMLHSDSNHKLPKKKFIFIAIAKQMLTTVEQVSAIVEYCINDCELFMSDGDFFWSERVFRNIEKRSEIIQQRSAAGRASAEKRRQQKSTVVEHPSTSVQQNSTKERKGKEIKGKESKYNLHFVQVEFRPIIEKWLRYKKSKSQDYKNQESVEIMVKRLLQFSNSDTGRAEKIIEEAISNNYTGFFPLKNESNGSDSKNQTTNSTSRLDRKAGFGNW